MSRVIDWILIVGVVVCIGWVIIDYQGKLAPQTDTAQVEQGDDVDPRFEQMGKQLETIGGMVNNIEQAVNGEQPAGYRNDTERIVGEVGNALNGATGGLSGLATTLLIGCGRLVFKNKQKKKAIQEIDTAPNSPPAIEQVASATAKKVVAALT
ncbi:hypothetical protein KS4_16170 [Poriferisphaera corsica]|uniref:Uncharacterized protein n=1 Tax=Poriferisphaera corsica TaxID=2528020 RepID=A0A517YTL5_9BACT|nr:hypothetical protein [Poriferisphaera corsica]QDU33566.1 hypothetical protein KS4_16170 [Poriferisphaera corsica]